MVRVSNLSVTGGGEAGTGFSNTAAVTTNEATVEDSTCDPFAAVQVTKDITSGPTAVGGGQQQVTYTITATNVGGAAGTYDLTDTLTYGGGITVNVATITNATPGGIATNPGWNGQGATTVVTGQPIGAGETHTYTATITVTVAPGTSSANGDCTLAAGESGTGLLNRAEVNGDGQTDTDDACVEVASIVPPPTPPAPTTPPTMPDPGELPGTGGNSTPILQIAVLLVVLGLLVLLATRRNLHRRRTV